MSRPSSRGASSEPGSQPSTPRNLPSPKDYTAAASEASEFVETCKRSVQSLKAAQEAHARAVGLVASLCVRGASLASGEVPAGDWPVSQPSFEAQQPALETAQELQRAAALLIEWQSRAAEAEAPLDALVATLNTFLASGVAACSARAATYEAAHREHAQSLTKLQGKADKRKLPALQQIEVEAKAKASHAASGAGEALALLRRDMQTAVLNTARSIGGSQLTLHARGLEQHSRALQALPGSK
ncbi:hypothetical protein EMIHUDRAFT_349407 [Emiliania huxleyi CCMP1516]|jgi:hypothetical protein|uniref:Uncharacterized protein n=2 Tax=Emiliania huxleyi TaxID=2903 RepID=A0A0D3L283_EMIH1|nr:hypothetical protein EMIHUDRAFT_443656 [Emiliania huxleyi CCMP1516]XP_005794547.1 hypothetical protein EMIHUDRAFT_349407 [Emiliania huxleyi CCMP1516]EOD25421.1 hypothetical protein EMIHUDRAFT_443656 [Emiliania huxleyi CCMP1516]EOD42118.1 hypothetical protein EMIHUDRAFT_349407 [Emiliania huxleyi CCMP1516]|mmetsp:Transcript_22423/g.72044  ORF Transcript_22423/g.72044 Transcript_22423/m.72044 type:complete len:243 (-) Transcript_22423:198-926(-)|eukprot:XP_005777850.1 hypothetical protein EMIHUDRAFT_443656 [Emiliania huxleyi CCMP1516]